MDKTTFFPGSSRRVVLGSPTLQTSNRRICLPVTMPLSDGSVVGMPDWLGIAFEQVSKHCKTFIPEIEQLVDLTLAFDNDKPKGELFEAPSAKVPAAEIRKFVVLRAGEPEDPEVELHFKAYIPFTRDFWGWIGEMAGHEVFMGFPRSLGAKAAPPEQTSIAEVETQALSSDMNPPADETKPKKKKSGPKDLAQFHQSEVAAGRTEARA